MKRKLILLAGIVLATFSVSSIGFAGIDDLVAGEYESDSEQAKRFRSAAKNGGVYATVSGHAGISMLKADAKGWDQNLTLRQIEERIQKGSNRKLAVVLLEKNYTGSKNPDESHTALVKLLMRVGFKHVIVTQAHSRLTIIEEVHKSRPQDGPDKPAAAPESKSEGEEKAKPESKSCSRWRVKRLNVSRIEGHDRRCQ